MVKARLLLVPRLVLGVGWTSSKFLLRQISVMIVKIGVARQGARTLVEYVTCALLSSTSCNQL